MKSGIRNADDFARSFDQKESHRKTHRLIRDSSILFRGQKLYAHCRVCQRSQKRNRHRSGLKLNPVVAEVVFRKVAWKRFLIAPRGGRNISGTLPCFESSRNIETRHLRSAVVRRSFLDRKSYLAVLNTRPASKPNQRCSRDKEEEEAPEDLRKAESQTYRLKLTRSPFLQ